MPILMAIIGALGAAVFWYYRARNAASAAHEIKDGVETAIGAVRRWSFRRKYEGNPVDAIDQPALAQGALTIAFAQLGAAQTTQQRNEHLRALQSALRVDLTASEELFVMGNWFVNECGGPSPAVTRIAKRLMRLSGEDGLDPALSVISDITDELTDRQRDALHDIKVIFRR